MKIFNSLSQKLEEFKPINNKRVTIYVCGITPYDTTHLGHAFTYISFDALIRYLKFKGFKVIYTQNVTDINDRDKDILERARQVNVSWRKLANFWTKRFLQDMAALNWTPPAHYLKASEQIVSIIRIITTLLHEGYAYQTAGSVYLDISQFPDFGRLSRLNKDQMMQTAEEFEEDLGNPDKKHPLDITLWKATVPGEPSHIPSFNSTLGPGRPGWHIECSAMSMSTLGKQLDIHGGGMDLKFPHHEAEIIQSEGATGNPPFVKVWMHTGTVFYRGQKMSKSKGNLVMVSELLKKYSSNAVRWLLLSHHWSKSWEYREEDLILAQKNIETIQQALASQTTSGRLGEATFSLPRSCRTERGLHERGEAEHIRQFIKIMDQNLDTPKALKFLLNLAPPMAGLAGHNCVNQFVAGHNCVNQFVAGKKAGLKDLYEVLGFV